MKKTLLLLLLIIPLCTVYSAPGTVKEHIHIDQFGYLCNAQKIAVISNPQTGYNSADNFTPGTATNNYQIRRWSDDVAVFSGTITPWNGGATHTQSGDKVWWFDFSSVTTPGDYYVYDQSNNVGSFRFSIGENVYKDVLKHAVRSYYYHRCGTPKLAAHAGTGWADAACHIGTLQDKNARLYNQAGNAATEKDLSGGWHDAGDYNKYVNFMWGTLTDLLLAYEENPGAWTDDYNLPESGNGVPDLLDEAKWELDWLLKMQQSDGSVLSIVGVAHASPPSASNGQSRYGPASTSSTLTCASVFALAAIQFKSLGIPSMTAYANTLQTAAENAWTWANTNPSVRFRNNDGANGSSGLGAGQQELDSWNQDPAEYAYNVLCRKISAAVFLYGLTGNAAYKTFVENNYNTVHLRAWGYAYLFEGTNQDMLLYYSKLPGITASVGNNIKNSYFNSVSNSNADNLPSYTNATDAYRAYLSDNNYTWGSNASKSRQGQMLATMNDYNLNTANATNYKNAAAGFIHYLHGVNPNSWVYLTNMNTYGAEKSVNELYHSWFYDGNALWDRVGTSTHGPAPGILTGGANPTWSLDGCCPSSCGGLNSQCVTLSPPSGQPIQKAYKDWNTSWPQNSWSVTENSTGYQSIYIRLLSKFVSMNSCGTLGVDMHYFTARHLNKNIVALAWKTDSETNNSHFEIERSQNGFAFEKIGEVKGMGTTQSASEYQWEDKHALNGTNYYRLKQVDITGETTYTDIKTVKISSEEYLHVYPNPADKELIVQLSLGRGPAMLEITNSLGQVVFNSAINLQDTTSINVSDFTEGIYVIKIVDADNYYTSRFIVK